MHVIKSETRDLRAGPLIEPGHTFGSITDKIGGVVLCDQARR